MHVWALRLWCETPAASGLHTTIQELQTCTLTAPALPNTTKKPRAHIKMSGFTPYRILAIFGPLYFLDVLTHNEFLPFFRPSSSPLTFHNVKNRGGGSAEGEPGGIAKNEEQKKTKKTTHRGKPRQTEIKQQRKTLQARQTKKSVFSQKTRFYARLGD